MDDRGPDRVTVWYAKDETREFLERSIQEFFPEISPTEGLTQGVSDSVDQPAAWLEILLPYVAWGGIGLAVWNVTAAPYLKALFGELGKSTGKSIAELVKGLASQCRERKRMKELARIVNEAAAIEGRPVGLLLGIPIQDGASGCGLVIDTTDPDSVEDQIAFFLAIAEGLQAATDYLKDQRVPYGDNLAAKITSEGLSVSWFDAQSIGTKSILVQLTDNGWIIGNKPETE